MQTSGHGNDALMILVPVGVSIIVGVMLFGGPAGAVDAIDHVVRDVATEAMRVSAWF